MGGRGLLGDEGVIMPFLGQEGGQWGSPPILGNKGMQPSPLPQKIEGGNGEDCLSWGRSGGTRTTPPQPNANFTNHPCNLKAPLPPSPIILPPPPPQQ